MVKAAAKPTMASLKNKTEGKRRRGPAKKAASKSVKAVVHKTPTVSTGPKKKKGCAELASNSLVDESSAAKLEEDEEQGIYGASYRGDTGSYHGNFILRPWGRECTSIYDYFLQRWKNTRRVKGLKNKVLEDEYVSDDEIVDNYANLISSEAFHEQFSDQTDENYAPCPSAQDFPLFFDEQMKKFSDAARIGYRSEMNFSANNKLRKIHVFTDNRSRRVEYMISVAADQEARNDYRTILNAK